MEKNHTVKDLTWTDEGTITECVCCNATLSERETYVYMWGMIYHIPMCETCYALSDIVMLAFFAGYNTGYNGY